MKDRRPVTFAPGDARARRERRRRPAANRRVHRPVVIAGETVYVRRRPDVADLPTLGCSACGDPMEPGSVVLAPVEGTSVVCSEECARTMIEE